MNYKWMVQYAGSLAIGMALLSPGVWASNEDAFLKAISLAETLPGNGIPPMEQDHSENIGSGSSVAGDSLNINGTSPNKSKKSKSKKNRKSSGTKKKSKKSKKGNNKKLKKVAATPED